MSTCRVPVMCCVSQMTLPSRARLGASIQIPFGYLCAISNLRSDYISNRPRLLLLPVSKYLFISVPRNVPFDISEQVDAWIMSKVYGSSKSWHLFCFWAKYGRHPRLYLIESHTKDSHKQTTGLPFVQ